MGSYQLGSVIDSYHPVGTEDAGADEGRDPSLPHQPLQALPELVHDLLLTGLRLGELDSRCVDDDTELLGPGDRPIDARGLEELLRRYASPVQARAADLLLLDYGDVEPGQPAAEGRSVTSRTTADNHHIELLGRLNHLLGQMSNLGRRDRSPASRLRPNNQTQGSSAVPG